MSFGTQAVRTTAAKEWQAEYLDLPTWTRNANWLAMPVLPDTATQINILYAVFDNASNYVSFTITGTGTTSVDWGDGTSNTYASNALASHQYSFSDPALTTTSEVYKQGMIVITTSGTITGVNFTTRPTGFTTAGFPQNMLDLQIITPNCSTFSFATSTSVASTQVRFPLLEHIYIQKVSAGLSITNGFANMLNLRQVDLGSTVTFTGAAFLFFGCVNLITVNGFVKTTTGQANSMFSGCSSLVMCPSLSGFNAAATNSMFINCFNLKYFPSDFHTYFASTTTMTSIFSGCQSLEVAPFITTSASLTDISSMFSGCAKLKSIPAYNFSTVTTATSAFASCQNLTTIPDMKWLALVSATSIFSNCAGVRTFPSFSWTNVTNASSAFASCFSMIESPVIITSASLTNIGSMFQNCYSMKVFNPFVTTSVTTYSSMFLNCSSLQSFDSGVTTTNTNSGTSFANMFQNCYSLTTAPAMNTSSATSIGTMFNNCYSLTSVPLYDFAGPTDISSIFANCYSLTSLPTFDTTTITNVGSMCLGCYCLEEIPAWNLSAATTYTAAFNNIGSLSRFRATGMNASFSIASNNLSGTALDEVYTNLSATGAGKTITVTGNWGTATDNPSIATAKGWTVTG